MSGAPWTLPIGAHVETTVGIERQTVTADVVARKRGWFGRQRYRVRYGVYDADIDARYVKTTWRGLNRLWASPSNQQGSNERG